MKIDVQKNWPQITALGAMLIFIIGFGIDMHESILMIQSSMDDKFALLQQKIDSMAQTQALQYDFENKQIVELQDREKITS